jgi:sterol 3beta-glucosyltransferase
MDFSETVEIKVLDKEDSCVDSYFFAYFHNLDLAVDQIRQSVQKAKTQPKSSVDDAVKDTTSHMLAAPSVPHPVPTDSLVPPSTLSSVRDKLTAPVGKLNSLLRPTVSPTPPSGSRPTSMISNDSGPLTISPGSITPSNQPVADHTYPPSLVHHPASQASDISSKSTWSVPVGVPSWLKNPSKRFFTSSPDIAPVPLDGHTEVGGIHEMAHQLSADHADFGFSIVDGIESNALDPLTVDKFRAAFAFDDKEMLLAGKDFLTCLDLSSFKFS